MRNERGAALLAVLWLSAILTAIAFSVATTVRGETERTSTLAEGVRGYYLATGALERALAYIEWGPGHQQSGQYAAIFRARNGPAELSDFPSGVATVEIIPESSKFDINSITPEELQRLLMNLGADPGRAQVIAAAVRGLADACSAGRHFHVRSAVSSGVPSFRARHASLEETEELLLVKGMTPELYHGGLRTRRGRPAPASSRSERLRVCVRISGSIRYQLGPTRCSDHDRDQPRGGGRDPAAASCHAFSKHRGTGAICAIRRSRFQQTHHWVATRFLRFAPRPGFASGKADTRTWRAPSARFTSFISPDTPLDRGLCVGMTTTDGSPRERS